ncbi:MAG: T9SS type A sorting domain-containing protein, partial [Candidatus Neomarinimicrobiota bacterium]|nr:T9SS type A sorting domain-containing protein [Candidatus Neomarinimicrobiota bacterium]
YGWNLSDNEWLIRVYLSGGAPRDVTFNDSKTMQAYVFGDGSGNGFRFCVDDNLPTTSSSNHEVSPWYPIDWIGWKLISWDMDVDGTGDWIGDGTLNGTMRFDSFQLTYTEGQSQFGRIYIDDFCIVDNVFLAVESQDLPSEINLGNNFPNPFNMSTEIFFSLGKQRPIQLSVYDILGNKIIDLANDTHQPGEHRVHWNGTNHYGSPVSSGVYIYSLISNNYKKSGRMILLK